MGDAGDGAVARGSHAPQVRLRVAVALAGDEHHVRGRQRRGQMRRGGAPVAPYRPAALRPGEQVAVVVRIREREDDAEDRPAVGDETDGHRASPPAGEVVAGAVVGIDEPDRPAGLAPRAARLFAEIAPAGERIDEPRPDQALGLDVRLGLVRRTSGAAGSVEIAPQDLAGRDRRVERRLERPSPVHGPPGF